MKLIGLCGALVFCLSVSVALGEVHDINLASVSTSSSDSSGFLSGKHVYLSPGHGWYFNADTAFNSWLLQRGNTYNIVEDLSNAEAVDLYLTKYLENAGAKVWMCRESDTNPRMIVVDNQDGAVHPENGTYTETGSWFDSTIGGFVNFRWPYIDGAPVFLDYASGGRNRLSNTTPTMTSSATWTPNIPVAGYYNVYASYSAYVARSTVAHYVVRHTGGVTNCIIDQQRHGLTWVYLGNFHFDAGLNVSNGSVTLQNDASSGSNVSADAVRFGGGLGLQDRGQGVSGYPRFEEAGRYHVFFQGAPSSVYDPVTGCYDAQTGCGAGDDASARPLYAAWQHVADEDALYLSWHSNAAGGRGTCIFYHESLPSTSTSAQLATKIHTEVINDIRTAFDPAWQDRGVGTLDVGELNPSNNNEMPASLIEIAFHDQVTDANYIRNPRFRQTVARAVYQGMAKYFADRDSTLVKLLPEPPTNLIVRNDGTGSVLLTWRAPSVDVAGLFGDPADSYLVFRSDDGLGFDQGRPAASTTFTDSNVLPGRVYYYKIAAVNQGGRSLETETLAVRTAPGGVLPKVLVVSGYDRVDRTLVPLKPSGSDVGSPARERPEWINSFNYIVQHAQSLDRLGFAFDSCANEAVDSGDLSLIPYAMVDWFAGRQANVVTEQPVSFQAFTSNERMYLRQFTDGGGHLFVSGAEILYDQDRTGDLNDDRTKFVREVLKVKYGGDDAATYQVRGTAAPFTPLPTPPIPTPGGASEYLLTTVGKLYVPDGYQPPRDRADLMVHFHGAESVVRDKLLQSGKSGVLVVINYPGLSAAYSGPFSDRHLFRKVIMEARQKLSDLYGRPISIGRLMVSSFSAGYGAVQQIIKYPEYDGMITDLVIADSLYASYVIVNGQNVPNPAQLKDYIRLAKRATEGRLNIIFTHSQIVPGTYASTRECADAIIQAVGASRVSASGTDGTGMTRESTVDKGGFHVRSYQGATGDDHLNHLRQMQEALKATAFPQAQANGVFTFSDGSSDFYDVVYPDRVQANGGSWVGQQYVGGTADGSGAAYSGNWRVVFLGYPFESLLTRQARDNVMTSVMRFLLPAEGLVGLSVTGVPAQANRGQSIPMTVSLTNSLDFNLNVDVWVRLTHFSGGPSFTYSLAQNQLLSTGGGANLSPSLTIPLGAPSGSYSLAFYTGDNPRHIINTVVKSINVPEFSGFFDDFDGSQLSASNWQIIGSHSGVVSVSGGQLNTSYSGSGETFSGVDLFTRNAFSGNVHFNAQVVPVQPVSGTHECGVSIVSGDGLPSEAAAATLALKTISSGGVTLSWRVHTAGGADTVTEIAGLPLGTVSINIWRDGNLVMASYDAGAGDTQLPSRAFSTASAYGWLHADNQSPNGSGAGGAYWKWVSAGGDALTTHPVQSSSIGFARTLPAEKAFLFQLEVTGGGADPMVSAQMANRSSGALWNFALCPLLPHPLRDSLVTALGRLEKRNGVWWLDVFRYVLNSGASPRVLNAANRTVAGDPTESLNMMGPDTTGLLFRTSGTVIGTDSTDGVFYIDDGSDLRDGLGPSSNPHRGLRARYNYPTISLTPPGVGTFAVVTGIKTVEQHQLIEPALVNGHLFPAGTVLYVPCLLPRDQSDIR